MFLEPIWPLAIYVPEMKVASLASSNTTFLDDIFHRPRDVANKNAPRAPNFRNDRG